MVKHSQRQGFGINPIIIKSVAQQVAEVAMMMDYEIAVIVGGGNIWRGKTGSDLGMDRGTATTWVCLLSYESLALQDSLEQLECDTRVLTSIEMKQVAEPYIRRRAIGHLEKKRVVIFAAGIGNPYFSTDTTAALRAAEVRSRCYFNG